MSALGIAVSPTSQLAIYCYGVLALSLAIAYCKLKDVVVEDGFWFLGVVALFFLVYC